MSGLPQDAIFKVVVPLLLLVGVGGGYYHLSSELSEARAKSDQLRQEKAGLRDSLRQVSAKKVTLKDSIQSVRRTYEKKDRANLDSLRSIAGRLQASGEGEASTGVEAMINPDSSSIQGLSAADSSAEDFFVHRVSSRSELIDFKLSLWVFRPGDEVEYSVTANPLARKISLLRYKGDEGITATRLQVTGGAVGSLQGYRRPEPPDGSSGLVEVRPEVGLVSGFREGRPVQPYGSLTVRRALIGPLHVLASGMVAGYPPTNFLVKTGISLDL